MADVRQAAFAVKPVCLCNEVPRPPKKSCFTINSAIWTVTDDAGIYYLLVYPPPREVLERQTGSLRSGKQDDGRPPGGSLTPGLSRSCQSWRDSPPGQSNPGCRPVGEAQPRELKTAAMLQPGCASANKLTSF